MRKSPLLLLGALALASRAQALDFNFISNGTMDPQALAGFQQAGALWSSLFSDKVTINLRVGYQDLGNDDVIGETGSTENAYSYSNFRSRLIADQTSALDASATASLNAGTSYTFVANGTSTASLGLHFAAANTVSLTRANAKAVGLIAGDDAGEDAEITFNSRFAFDLDRSDGIAANQMDFVGIAAHEIGHALGFTSGVDVLDYSLYLYATGQAPLFSDAAFANFHSSLDLFRYSQFGQGATAQVLRDWTVGGNDDVAPFTYNSYLSFDGGTTKSGLMSAGAFYGDGGQASHWKSSAYVGSVLGIMDPFTDNGLLLGVSQRDVDAFDAIGWNVKPVPEPASLAALGLGAAAFLRRRRRR